MIDQLTYVPEHVMRNFLDICEALCEKTFWFEASEAFGFIAFFSRGNHYLQAVITSGLHSNACVVHSPWGVKGVTMDVGVNSLGSAQGEEEEEEEEKEKEWHI